VTDLRLAAAEASLRTWEPADLETLVHAANNRAVWRNLTHLFPHPYRDEDARQWIAACRDQNPPRDLAIDVGGSVVGACGIELGHGVGEFTGHLGYWLGEAHWNRGIATAVVESFLTYIWATFRVERLQAEVFAWNPASARVLEKNGFELEGTRRKAIFKDGQLIDEWMYVLMRPASLQP
jgi:RimJ/RimL family protein N-acetyltransferase